LFFSDFGVAMTRSAQSPFASAPPQTPAWIAGDARFADAREAAGIALFGAARHWRRVVVAGGILLGFAAAQGVGLLDPMVANLPKAACAFFIAWSVSRAAILTGRQDRAIDRARGSINADLGSDATLELTARDGSIDDFVRLVAFRELSCRRLAAQPTDDVAREELANRGAALDEQSGDLVSSLNRQARDCARDPSQPLFSSSASRKARRAP
jgi:hypothetical protein